MTEKEKDLICDFASNTISEKKFLKHFSYDISKNPNIIVNLLKEAYENKNAEDVEGAISLVFRYNLVENNIELICKLLVEQWHYSHENIVSYFQQLKNPETIDCLYKTTQTKYDYLEYNDCYSLIVKCCWALGDINTPESKEKLRLLAQSDNEIMQNAAKEQLERDIWD